MATTHTTAIPMPGEGLKLEKMPGHWVLARMGKRVLRPGGLALTEWMLDALAIGPGDTVVEFAPGMGLTAALTARRRPEAFTAVERDRAAAARVQAQLQSHGYRCIQGDARATGLPDACASVVYGEAMLTMQMEDQKRAIIAEAARLLRPGGRYAIHEICFEGGTEESRREACRDLTRQIHHGVQPLPVGEWTRLFEEAGFTVARVRTVPMHLLEPARLLRDEGLIGTLRFVLRLMLNPAARRRAAEMRATFRRHSGLIRGMSIVAVRN